MRAVLQRVKQASVSVEGEVIGEIKQGYLIYLGIAEADVIEDAHKLIKQILSLRIFSNEDGKFDRNIRDVDGDILLISQFTLLADYAKGNRPSFHKAAKPEVARELFDGFHEALEESFGKSVPTGSFGAHMMIDSINDGPVTLIL